MTFQFFDANVTFENCQRLSSGSHSLATPMAITVCPMQEMAVNVINASLNAALAIWLLLVLAAMLEKLYSDHQRQSGKQQSEPYRSFSPGY